MLICDACGHSILSPIEYEKQRTAVNAIQDAQVKEMLVRMISSLLHDRVVEDMNKRMDYLQKQIDELKTN